MHGKARFSMGDCRRKDVIFPLDYAAVRRIGRQADAPCPCGICKVTGLCLRTASKERY
jgi:hypothetical protein